MLLRTSPVSRLQKAFYVLLYYQLDLRVFYRIKVVVVSIGTIIGGVTCDYISGEMECQDKSYKQPATNIVLKYQYNHQGASNTIMSTSLWASTIQCLWRRPIGSSPHSCPKTGCIDDSVLSIKAYFELGEGCKNFCTLISKSSCQLKNVFESACSRNYYTKIDEHFMCRILSNYTITICHGFIHYSI